MNKPADYYSPVEEVDLTEVVRKLVQFLKTNLKLILLFVLLGTCLGVAAYYLLPRKYNVQMIAGSRILSSQEISSIVDSWSDLMRNGEYELLSQKLNIPAEALFGIKSLRATSMSVAGAVNPLNVFNEENPFNAFITDAFIIEASVLDNTRVDTIQAGIIHYLENSPYVQQRIEAEKRRLNALRNRISQEIAQLDSTKILMQNLIRRGGGGSSAFISEPGTINSEIVDLYNQQLNTEKSLQFVDNIQVISGFDRRKHPDSPELSICLAIGAAAGFVAALVVAFFRALDL